MLRGVWLTLRRSIASFCGRMPASRSPCTCLGVVAHQAGNNEMAVDLIGQALALQPDYANAHYNLGNVLKKLGRADEAIASYQQSLAQNPESADAHVNLATFCRIWATWIKRWRASQMPLCCNRIMRAAHFNMANALKSLGAMEDVLAPLIDLRSLFFPSRRRFT